MPGSPPPMPRGQERPRQTEPSLNGGGDGDLLLGGRAWALGDSPSPPHLCAGADGVTSVAVAGGEGLAGYGQRRAASSSVPSVVDPGQQALCPLAPHGDP